MNIGYARVSTDEQSLDMQIDALKESGCEKVFTETASGAQRDRPELKRALEYARPGDTIVVWRLDRLARSLKQLIETVEDLKERDVHLRSLAENVETRTPGGQLVFHVFGALAQFERELIRERTMAGLKAAKAKGKIGGRPRALSDEDVVAAKAMLKDNNITVADVAKRLGVSEPTLYRYLPAARSA